MLWVTDPWATLDHSQDTTLRLMQEAIIMDIPTYWSASDQLFLNKNHGQIQAVKLKKTSDLLSLDEIKFESFSLSSFQQIHDLQTGIHIAYPQCKNSFPSVLGRFE